MSKGDLRRFTSACGSIHSDIVKYINIEGPDQTACNFDLDLHCLAIVCGPFSQGMAEN